jgi:hypothetical protein
MPNLMSFTTPPINHVVISNHYNEVIPQELPTTPPQHTDPKIDVLQTNQNNEPFDQSNG